MKKTILEFCGIKPIKIHSFGPVKGAKSEKKKNGSILSRNMEAKLEGSIFLLMQTLCIKDTK